MLPWPWSCSRPRSPQPSWIRVVRAERCWKKSCTQSWCSLTCCAADARHGSAPSPAEHPCGTGCVKRGLLQCWEPSCVPAVVQETLGHWDPLGAGFGLRETRNLFGLDWVLPGVSPRGVSGGCKLLCSQRQAGWQLPDHTRAVPLSSFSSSA